MRKIILASIVFLISSSLAFAAGPRSWGKSGTATIANAQLTVGGSSPFGPTAICVSNLDTTDNIFIDWTDGVAATTDNSTNLKIPPLKDVCFNLNNPNVVNRVIIGIIASANTPAYNIVAIAAQ